MGICQLLNDTWDAVQIELKGEYSPTRVLALNDYTNVTPWCRIVAFILLTPLPCLVYICLPETVNLSSPSLGMGNNKTFFGRFFLSYTMWCLLQMHMISERMPLLSLSKKQLVVSAVTVAALSTGVELLYVWWIGFPVPYTIHMMAVPYVSLMFFALAIAWYPHVRLNPGLLWKIADAILICVCHGLVIIGYPLFYFAFQKMNAGIESAAFSMVLPYQPSFTTTIGLMIANAFQVVLMTRDIDVIRKRIADTARRIVWLTRNDKYGSKLPGDRVATSNMLPRAADIFQRYTFDTVKIIVKRAQRVGPQESDWNKPFQQHPLVVLLFDNTIGKSATSFGPKSKSMIGALSELEQLERKYATLVRKLMYASEFSILTAYAELITPIVYSLYLFIVFHMPNRDYYSQISRMDSTHLAKTVLNVLLYSLVELSAFIALTQTLKRRLKFSTMHQLAFVLDRQMLHVQTAIILWVFYTTQISLEHYGTDYSFAFAWLQGNTTSA